jgi:hypothetical protein
VYLPCRPTASSVSLVNKQKQPQVISRARDEEMLFPVIEVQNPFGVR